MSGYMPAQKKRGSRAWKIILGILVFLVILAVVAEFGLRWFIGNQMTKSFEETNAEQGITTDEKPEVSFGKMPLLLGMLGGSIPQMNMYTPETLQIDGDEILGQPETHVEIHDMTLSENPVAGEMITTTMIPDEFLLATFQRGIREQSELGDLGNLIISDIRANGNDGTLDVELGAGLATLVLTPSAQDGALALTAERSTVLGFDLPQEASDEISSALTEGLKEQFVGDLKLDDVKVSRGVVEMTITGNNVPLNDMGNQLGGGAQSGA